MLAQGFTVAFLAGLVRDRFATAELNTANVVWVEITDLGREVLASVSRPPAGRSQRRALEHHLGFKSWAAMTNCGVTQANGTAAVTATPPTGAATYRNSDC
jgi:hypothetical protein